VAAIVQRRMRDVVLPVGLRGDRCWSLGAPFHLQSELFELVIVPSSLSQMIAS
jgi:hypothetical protein